MRKSKPPTANRGAATRKAYLQSRPQRERLFCAALAVALEQGFGHVTMNAIAEKAGVSKGGLLYHFACKADLIRALLDRYTESCLPADGNAMASSMQSETEQLAIAVLIAASDDPLLLATVACRLGLRDPVQDPERNNNYTGALARRLAGKLRYDIP